MTSVRTSPRSQPAVRTDSEEDDVLDAAPGGDAGERQPRLTREAGRPHDPPFLGGVFDGVLRGLPSARRRRQERFTRALDDIAAAMSSTVSPDAVLRTVVDQVKDVVDAQKAVLCLFDNGDSQMKLNERTLFVRGCRDQYPEEWWRAQLADVAELATQDGVPHAAVRDGAVLLTVPVKIKNRPIGVLTAINPKSKRFTSDQVSLMAILGALAGTVIENARLHSESHFALLADERSRIAKEMHDGLSQSLFSASLEIDVARKRRAAHPEELDQRLEHIQTIIVRSISELRRYIYDLRPVSIGKLGLVGAMDIRVKEIGQAQGLATRVYVEGDPLPLPPSVEACIYRVTQEAVANAAKHAVARHAIVMLKYDTTRVELTVTDDGRGFDVAAARDRAEREESLGLQSMQDRVQAEGGTLEIKSGDSGTTIKVTLPC